MIKRLYLLAFLFIISCSVEKEDHQPQVDSESYTAQIGDLITLTGTNLLEVETIRIFSRDYNAPSAIIYAEYGESLQDHYLESQTDTEITFVLPVLNAESFVLQVGDQEIPLQVKGFIPLNVSGYDGWDGIMDIKVVDDDKAFALYGKDLFLFTNGYYDMQKVSGNVHFFGILENGDQWYARSSDYELYEIFYKNSSGSSYEVLTSFSKRQLDYLNTNPHNIIVTSQKEVYIFSHRGIFIKRDGKLHKAIDLYDGLEDLIDEEDVVLQLSPQGKIHGEVLVDPGNPNNNSYFILTLNPTNHTYHHSQIFNSHPTDLQIKNNTGFVLLIQEREIYKSLDGGNKWNKSSDFPTISGEIRSANLEMIDENTALLFLHTSVGASLPYTTVYKTSDGGQNWEVFRRFNSPVQKEKFLYKSDFANTKGLFYFTDFTWDQLYKYIEE